MNLSGAIPGLMRRKKLKLTEIKFCRVKKQLRIILPLATGSPVPALAKSLTDMNSVEAMEFLRDRLLKTKTNEEFIISMND